MICKQQAPRIKDFLNKLQKVDPILLKVIDFTGKVRNLKSNPTVQEIDALVPDDTALQGYFNLALNAITGTSAVVSSIANKLHEWLKDKTPLEVDSAMAKLAATATQLGHEAESGDKYGDNFYALAVEGTVYGLNKKSEVK